MSSAKDARLGLEMWLAEAGVLVAPGVQAGGGAWLEAWVSSEAAAVGAHVKRLEAAEAEAAEVEAARVEAERVEAERVEAARVEAEKVEAERVEAERVEAERVVAGRVEAARLEAEKVEAARAEAAKAEATKAEAAKAEAAKVEAARAEAARVEAARAEAARMDTVSKGTDGGSADTLPVTLSTPDEWVHGKHMTSVQLKAVIKSHGSEVSEGASRADLEALLSRLEADNPTLAPTVAKPAAGTAGLTACSLRHPTSPGSPRSPRERQSRSASGSKSPASPLSPEHVPASEACRQYRVDVTASRFGDCTHRRALSTPEPSAVPVFPMHACTYMHVLYLRMHMHMYTMLLPLLPLASLTSPPSRHVWVPKGCACDYRPAARGTTQQQQAQGGYSSLLRRRRCGRHQHGRRQRGRQQRGWRQRGWRYQQG